MSCYSALDYSLYADEAMPAAGALLMAEHLRSCAPCRAQTDRLRAEGSAIAEVLLEEPLPHPKPLVLPLTLLRNVGAAVALFYAPALLASRHPALRFVPALVEHLQLAVAFLAVLLASSVFLLWMGFRRLRGLALLLVLALPAGAATVRTGEVVRIDGVVDGDLVAFARTVEIRGTVHGRVFAFAKEVEITGTIDRSAYTWGQTVTLGPTAYVREVMAAACESAAVAGRIGGGLRFYGENLTVADSARIAFGVSAQVGERRLVRIPARISADIDDGRISLTDPMLYVHRIAEFLAALIVALVLGRMFPIAFEDSVVALTHWWRSLAIGAATLVAALVAAVLLAVTLVGAPVAALILMALAFAIYCAKLLIGQFAGRLLLPSRPPPVQMAFGLALFFAAVALPWGIGGALWGVVMLTGVGALGWTMLHSIRARRPS